MTDTNHSSLIEPDDEIQKVDDQKLDRRTRAGRAAARSNNGNGARELPRGQAMGRNGEILSRKRTTAGDIFNVPAELIPEGWEYQWAAISVTGNTEILLDQNLMMAENGWRPVPSDRYPGRFMPEGHKGNIVRGGQMLMERPKSLCDEARAEDIRNAKQLISDRNDSLKLTNVAKGLGSGYEMSGRQRGTGGRIQMSIDKGVYADDAGNIASIPKPQYQLADDEG
jgi:hypothetical protein